jgi:hypothetical protein
VIAVGVKSIVTFPITEIQILDEKSRPWKGSSLHHTMVDVITVWNAQQSHVHLHIGRAPMRIVSLNAGLVTNDGVIPDYQVDLLVHPFPTKASETSSSLPYTHTYLRGPTDKN